MREFEHCAARDTVLNGHLQDFFKKYAPKGDDVEFRKFADDLMLILDLTGNAACEPPFPETLPKKGQMNMQKTLSLAVVFAILAWTVSLNMARAECYSPSYPTSYNQGQYNRCVEDEMVQQQFEQWRQTQQLQKLEDQLRHQRY